MHSIPWIYEPSYMWKLLALSVYQSKHSYGQDLIKQPRQDGSQISNKSSYHFMRFSLSYFLSLDQKKKKKKSLCKIILCMCLYTYFPKVRHLCLWLPHIEIMKPKCINLENLWAEATSLLHSLGWSKFCFSCTGSSHLSWALAPSFNNSQNAVEILLPVSRDWWLSILQ